MTESTGFSAEAAVVATEDATTLTQLKAVKRVCALQVSVRYSQDRVLPRRRDGGDGSGESIPLPALLPHPVLRSTGVTSAPVNQDGMAEPRKSLPTSRIDKVLL